MRRTLLCTQQFRYDAQRLQEMGWASGSFREVVQRLVVGERLRPQAHDSAFTYKDAALRQCDVGEGAVLLYRVTSNSVVLVRLLIPSQPLERFTYAQARGPFMLFHHLRLALRHMQRQRGYAFLNITGLALGLACSLLIFLFIRDEFSYDRFHDNADQIYRVTREVHQITPSEARMHMAGSSPLLAPTMQEVYPEVVASARVKMWEDRMVAHENQRFYEMGWIYADPGLFEVFDFALKQGNPAAALAEPFSVVLTEAMAHKYFGDADPIGKTLVFNESDSYTVTGVLAEVPANSHLQFDFVASFSSLPAIIGERFESWRRIDVYTYIQLDPTASAEALQAKLDAFPKQYMDLSGRFEQEAFLHMQPLTDIHLYSDLGNDVDTNSDIRYIYLFGAIALLVLLIACINYMNLATARAIKRAREVGVRKVAGASQGVLVRQFLLESVLFAVLALGGALLMVWAALPSFNTLVQKELAFTPWADANLLLTLLGLVLGVGLLAGAYPAFLLARFRPALVLKGAFSGRARRTVLLRKGLVVFQFAMSVVLIVCTITVQHQLDFVQNQRLGFEADQAIVIPVRNAEVPYPAFKTALLQQPAVKQVTTSSSLPSRSGPIQVYAADGFENITTDKPMLAFEAFLVDEDFLETLEITLLEGRNLDPMFATDSTSAILINETAVRTLGWEDPLGQRFPGGAVVVGVVQDFFFRSRKVQPMDIMIGLTQEGAENIVVKVETHDIAATLAMLEAMWKDFAPAHPFEYSFLDEDFQSLYQAEQRLGQIFSTFTLLTIVIACLGLFGLATYAAEQRVREVGIRKALGASVQQVVVLLSREFLWLVALAMLIGMPLAYWGMEMWLADFAHRITIGAPIFVATAALTLAIGALTVGSQALRAANANPVEALRHE